jgi:hypothetical protein
MAVQYTDEVFLIPLSEQGITSGLDAQTCVSDLGGESYRDPEI